MVRVYGSRWYFGTKSANNFLSTTTHVQYTRLESVVFTRIRIESDRHRNWKWVQGALSVILEVRDLQERVGLRMLVNGLDRIWWRPSTSWQESIGLTLSQFVRERKYLSAMRPNKRVRHKIYVVLKAMRPNKRATYEIHVLLQQCTVVDAFGVFILARNKAVIFSPATHWWRLKCPN